MSKSNAMLTNVSLIKHAYEAMKPTSRIQLNKTVLGNVKLFLEHCLNGLTACNQLDTFTGLELLDVIDVIKLLCDDVTFTQTDLVVKESMVEKIVNCRDRITLAAGKYYSTTEFDYSDEVKPILIYIVDTCVNHGMYFGKGVK